jgi:hypothetical protein
MLFSNVVSTCSQIWLRFLDEDCQATYLTKLKKKHLARTFELPNYNGCPLQMKQGLSHCGLAIYIKYYFKAKEEL